MQCEKCTRLGHAYTHECYPSSFDPAPLPLTLESTNIARIQKGKGKGKEMYEDSGVALPWQFIFPFIRYL